MRRNRRFLIASSALLIGLSMACASTPARRAARRLPLTPCTLPGVDEQLVCGTYSVWEDRQARRGRKIDLNVVVVPAREPRPAAGAIFHFVGGPGGAATRRAGWYVDDPLRRTRDMVFIDQRGTGKSNGLDCEIGGDENTPGELGEIFPVADVKACRAKLEPSADLGLYTSTPAMDDYDEVRRWLGYEKITLVGGSYGSITAQTYMQRHPASVRAAYLRNVMSLERSALQDQAPNAQVTLDGMLAACAAEEACATAFPEVGAELPAVLDRLENAPAEVRVVHPLTHEEIEFTLRRDYLAEHLRRSLYYLSFARALPMAIHLAHGEPGAAPDYGPLSQLALLFDSSYSGIADGMLLTIYCSEDLPSFDPDAAIAAAEATIFGSYRIRQQIQACEHWPTGPVAKDFRHPRRLEIPTLLISGGLDPVNPPKYADQALSHLTNGLHLVIPDAHHGTSGLTKRECLWNVVEAFLERGTTDGLDTSCLESVHALPFLTDRADLEAHLEQLAGS
jgi:pimeloyl-ACP methyl ester carboxylesterase